MANLVQLSSEAGQQRLQAAFQKGLFNQPFIQGIFSKQIGRCNCGIQTCALLLGAAKLGKVTEITTMPGTKWTIPVSEDQMFEYETTLKVTTPEIIDKGGMSLQNVYDVLKSHGDVKMFYASDSNVDEFRAETKRALAVGKSQVGVMVNYHMPTLGQGELLYGHHSPLAAYDEETDTVLILDTWPATYECWAKVDDLFKAMNTKDDATKNSRGFCVIRF